MGMTRIVILASCWSLSLGIDAARAQGRGAAQAAPSRSTAVTARPASASMSTSQRPRTGGRFGRVTTRSGAAPGPGRPAVARSGAAKVAPISIRENSLHPYSDRALEDSQGEGMASRDSSWRAEPGPQAEPARPRAQSYNYFPGMRPGLAVQSPLGYGTGPFVGTHCTPSRSMTLASGGYSHR